jgi:hypothetical protein
MSHTIELSRIELVNLALGISAAASSAYIDDRLTVAAINHTLAAKLWTQAGYNTKAAHHQLLAQAIDLEAIEAAVDEASEEA